MTETGILFKADNENICCIYERESHSDMIYQLKLHNKLACILGYKMDKVLENNNDEPVIITLLCDKDNLTSNPKYPFDEVPNLEHSIPPWLILYCDVVKPTIVGHSYVPILKILPIEHKSGQNFSGIFYEFDSLEYFEIGINSFQTITFQLRMHDGNFVEFEGGGSVQLTLAFKKST